MSDTTYTGASRSGGEKPVVWLSGAMQSPPFSPAARRLAGVLLKRVQRGERLTMPFSRPMPTIGPRCHELRIVDGVLEWRIFHHVSPTAIVVLEIAAKQTRRTPRRVIEGCRRRLALYLSCQRGGDTP